MQVYTKLSNEIINSIKGNLGRETVFNTDLMTKVAAGINLSTEERHNGEIALNKASNLVDAAIDSVVAAGTYGISLEDYRVQAAKDIAKFAFNPQAAAEAFANLRDPKEGVGSVHKSYGFESVDDALELGEIGSILSTEAYDGQALNNAVYFSVAFNLGAAKQDNFAETFFPTIAISPVQSGIVVSMEFVNLIEDFLRNPNGEKDAKKFNRIPMIKAMYNNSIWGTDKNRIVPVYRESGATANTHLFVTDLKTVSKVTGEAIETAPLKFGAGLSLLAISQTDAQLARGVMDNTDALDRTLNLDKVYVTLSANVGGTDKTEYFAFNVGNLVYKNFIANPQGHNKDMVLNFRTESLVINTGTTKTATGEASEILASLPQNYSIVFEAIINGNANAQDGDIEVNVSKFVLGKVLDSGKVEVPASTDAGSDYKKLADVAATIAPVGYDVEAWTTNSNIRKLGRMITCDRYSQTHAVPNRSGVTVRMPVNNAQGVDGDASSLAAQIQAAGFITSTNAVMALDKLATNMRTAGRGLLPDFGFEGIGRYVVESYFEEETFSLANVIDSKESNKRDEDIKCHLLQRIYNIAMDMYINSNYGPAFDALRGNLGGKITIIVGTDPNIERLISTKDGIISLSDRFDMKIVSTFNEKVAGKVFISFSVFDEGRNTTANPLSFGFCAWAPTLSYEVTRTVNGATSRELHNNPRFLHVVNLPVLAVLNVTDVVSAFNKITTNIKTM